MDAMDEESFKLAMQLMQEEIAASESGGGSEKYPAATETDETKQKQLDLDLQIAMEIQNALNAQQPPKPVFVPPPIPFGGSMYKPDHSEVKVPPSAEAIKRLIADLREVINSKDPTIHVHPDPDDITHISALIIGPEGTPYEGGFFHFEMHFPHDYPWRPPKVHLETTDGGTVRFNPNLYACGKVCLSILGTWSGPSWTEIQTMLSTLLSIQSLMNEKPYHNEPGHEVERNPRDVTDYNDCIEHETLRVAVIGMLENPTTPAFLGVMEESFLQNYDKYLSWIEKRREKDGKQMRDPFGESRGVYKYGSFVSRLQKLKELVEKRREEARIKQLEQKQQEDEDSETSDSEDEEEEEKMIVTSTTTATVSSDQDLSTPASEVGSSAMDLETAGAPNPPAGPAPTPTPLPASTEQPNPFAAFFTPTSTPAGSSDQDADPDYLLALQLQAQLNGDAELAQQLQNELARQQAVPGGFNTAPTTGFGIQPSTFTPVKPPTMEELKAEVVQGDQSRKSDAGEEDYDPSIVCLICKQSPISYIVLPSCEQPHIYCYSCAEKRASMPSDRNDYRNSYYGYSRRNRYGRQSNQSLTCVLCNAVSHLDGVGLKALKRHRKRKRHGSDGWCSEHKEEMSLYCMDDNQLICLLCAGSAHSNHTYEALETAQNKLMPEVNKGLRELENKWGKLEQFVKEVEQKQGNLESDMEKKRRQAKEEIDKLRRLLDEKEKEIDTAITNVFAQKQHSLKSKVDKAKSALEKIPGAIAGVQGILEDKSALSFLQKYEDNEQETRDLCNVPVPAIGRGWFTMPPLVVDHIEHVLKQSLKYQNMRRNMYGHPFGGMPEEEGDFDEDAEEETIEQTDDWAPSDQ